MSRYSKFHYSVTNSSGTALSGVSVEVRKQGATVSGTNSITTGQAVTVNHSGMGLTTDDVAVNTGSTTYAVDTITATAINLSGFVGTLALVDDDRITYVTNLPTLYNDIEGAETKSNPLTTDSLGNVTAWAPDGYYDLHISGGSATTTLIQDFLVGSIPGGDTYYPETYGAVGDGTTDDAAAIQRAIDACERFGGGVVQLQGGTGLGTRIYAIGAQLSLNANAVTFRGMGRNATEIKALASFPTSTALIDMTNASGIFGTTIQDIAINCNDVSGSIGIDMDGPQEGSGVIRIQIINVGATGILVDSNTQQAFIYDCDISGMPNSTGIGIDVNGVGGLLTIRRCSIGGDATASIGILVDGAGVTIEDCHFENVVDGVQANSTCLVSGLLGHSSVTDLLQIGTSGGVTALNLNKNGGTNTINDLSTGATLTTTEIVNFYSVHSDSNRSRLHTIPSKPWRLSHPIGRDIGTFTAADTTPSVAGGDVFRTANTAFTTITQFDDGVEGQMITIICGDNLTGIADGGNFEIAGNFVSATNTVLQLVSVTGSNWFQVAPKSTN